MIDLCIQSKGGDRNLNRIGYVVHPINIDSDGMVSEQALVDLHMLLSCILMIYITALEVGSKMGQTQSHYLKE